MQNIKLGSAVLGFLSVFSVSFLFSCTKNAADASSLSSESATSANTSSNAANENIIHAVPFETTVYVPCANGGVGEYVELSGYTNFIYQMQWNNNSFSMVYHENAHQVTGVGTISGDIFVASGGTNGTVTGSWVNNQWVGNTTSIMKVVSPNANFTVTYKDRITVTSDGTVTVENTDITVVCN